MAFNLPVNTQRIVEQTSYFVASFPKEFLNVDNVFRTRELVDDEHRVEGSFRIFGTSSFLLF